jgi:RNA polymerase sigma factor (sigma-70 family)
MQSEPPRPTDPSAALLARWQRDGDREALDELLRIEIAILRERLNRKGARQLSPHLSSSDVAQEAVLGLVKVRETPSFDEPAGLRAYLWRSAMRLLAQHAERTAHAEARVDLSQSQVFATALASSGGFGAVEQSEREIALAVALELIQPHERQILELVYFRQLPLEAAAEALSISHEAAKKRVARARRALAEKLGDWTELIG